MVKFIPLFLSAVFSLIVLSRRRTDAATTLAWIFGFYIFPYVTVPFYLLVGVRNFRRRKRNKPRPIPIDENFQIMNQENISETFKKVAHLAETLTNFPAVGGNRIHIFND